MTTVGAAAHGITLRVVHDWYCPDCGLTDQTQGGSRPPNRFHPCPKHGRLKVPLLPAGTKAKVSVNEWPDYVGRELVQTVPESGRPVSSVTVERDDGQDCVVFAPTARVSA